MDFSSVTTLASIFCEIIERQYSIRRAGFPRVSNCHCTRNGLAEYPDAPPTQTIPPLQSIRIRLTFCSISHESTSKETLPLPVEENYSFGQVGVAAEKQICFPLLRIMGQAIFDVERASVNAERDAMSRKDQCGLGFRSFGASERSSLDAASPDVTSGRPGADWLARGLKHRRFGSDRLLAGNCFHGSPNARLFPN